MRKKFQVDEADDMIKKLMSETNKEDGLLDAMITSKSDTETKKKKSTATQKKPTAPAANSTGKPAEKPAQKEGAGPVKKANPVMQNLMQEKQEPKNAVISVSIRPSSLKTLDKYKDMLNYPTRSAFIDALLANMDSILGEEE